MKMNWIYQLLVYSDNVNLLAEKNYYKEKD